MRLDTKTNLSFFYNEKSKLKDRQNEKVYQASFISKDVYDKSTMYRSLDNQLEVLNKQFNIFPYQLERLLIKSKNGELYSIQGQHNLVVKVHKRKEDTNNKVQVAAIYKQLSDAKIGPLVPENFAFVAPKNKKKTLYIVMKHYRENLHSFVARVRPDDIPRIENRISFILDTMFDMGLLHIDAKPANFLVDENNNIVISDFDTEFVLAVSGTEIANMLDGKSIDVGPHRKTFLDVIKLQIGRESNFKLFRDLNERVSKLLNPRTVEPDTFHNDLETILPSTQELDDFYTFQQVLNHRDISRMIEHYKVAKKHERNLYGIFTP